MSAPYELLAGPWTVWTGAANATEPVDFEADPPVAYTKLGTLGSDEYDEDGVEIELAETLEFFRGLGKTGRRKAWRTEEDPKISLKVHDMTPTLMAKALNGNAITSTAAGADTSGAKRVSMHKGHNVQTYTLLLRSDEGSPFGDDYTAQFWFPLVVVESASGLVGKKGKPMGVEFEFAVLYDSTNGFGGYRAQDAVSSS